MSHPIRNVVYASFLILLSCSLHSSDKFSSAHKSYHIENVTIYNETAQIRIAGTLTYPDGEGPFPAVVLIPGSGRTNRDGSDNAIHRPLFEIADYLSKRGFAVLRCDKRGVGGSEGALDFQTTLEDLASDVKASVDFLYDKPITDRNKLGLIGHSSGGLVAAKVTAEQPAISFVVLLASPGVKQGEIVSQQLSDIPKTFGIVDQTINKFKIIVDSTMIILTSKENAKIKREIIEEMYGRQVNRITDDEIGSMSKVGYVFQRDAQLYSSIVMKPFWYEFYTLDPRSIFIHLDCPVLSIIGETDLQVRPGPNQKAIELALQAGNNEDYTIITPKRMNHLFQYSESGSPDEYFKTQETMSKSVLDTIYHWILDSPDHSKITNQ